MIIYKSFDLAQDKPVSKKPRAVQKLSKEQAIHLARVLLAVSQDWEEVDITAYRFDKRRSDETYHITVTSFQPGGTDEH